MSQSQRILVTGANGFVGKAVCRALLDKNFLVRAALRNPSSALRAPSPTRGEGKMIEHFVIGDLNNIVDWSAGLENIDTVIHLASRVHVMQETAKDPLTLYRQVNVTATEQLAQAAVQAGVRRLIYISSIKVNGEMTLPGQKFSESDTPNPQDVYAKSKWEAEECLRDIAKNSNLEIVILRPPLIYGAGVAANFLKLIQSIKKGLPLPLGAVNNQRSLIYVENFADIIVRAINNTNIRNQTYLVSDGEDVATPELIRRLATALNKPARLIPIPPKLLQLLGKITGKQAAIDRLLGSLIIDNSKLCNDLNWQPPYTMQQAFKHDFT